MTTSKQTFPPVTIEVLPNGLLRLEDETNMEGLMFIELHPAQVQVLASMVGFSMPDKAKRAIERIHERIKALSEQASELEGLLYHALNVQDLDVTPEWKACQFIALNLAQVARDIDDLQTPALDPGPEVVNGGGQMTIPM